MFFVSTETSFASATFGFGGKVLTNTIPPNIICTGVGTLITLSTNIGGAVNTISSPVSGGSAGQKITGSVSGIYKMIPFYATDPTKKPRKDGWILGKADSVPNMSICKLQVGEITIPIPVRKTSIYNISGGNYEKSSTYNSVDSNIIPSNTPSYTPETNTNTG